MKRLFISFMLTIGVPIILADCGSSKMQFADQASGQNFSQNPSGVWSPNSVWPGSPSDGQPIPSMIQNPEAVLTVECPDDSSEPGVVICHVPPGNPNERHTLCIGLSAVNAHMSHHPDFLGPCDQPPASATPAPEPSVTSAPSPLPSLIPLPSVGVPQ